VLDTDGISIEVTAIQSKRYYIARLPPNDPLAVEFRGDITLLDALLQATIDEILVDTDEILVIRGDPENPLIITCNYDDITRRGLTRDNIRIVENDIIYLTPSVVGWITYGVAVLISPIKPIRDLLLGSSQIVASSESFGQSTGRGYGNNNNNNFNCWPLTSTTHSGKSRIRARRSRRSSAPSSGMPCAWPSRPSSS
jgi:hypothetical protein